ncbi:MAG: response regulator transcription factor [Pseudanabaenaceae cyanobacterium]
MATIRLLIVEDDPMMQLGLEQALGDRPTLTLVGVAADGFRGVQQALQLAPAVVIMDIGLPRLDGIAATQRIKEALPETRVVMLTSHTSETEILAALAAGADAYCVKGTNIDRLVWAIEAVMEGAMYIDPQVAHYALEKFREGPKANGKGAQLSQREMEVLQLLVEGKSNPEIAASLYLSPNTVKTHVRGIMNKLAVDDRVKAAVVALREGLVR